MKKRSLLLMLLLLVGCQQINLSSSSSLFTSGNQNTISITSSSNTDRITSTSTNTPTTNTPTTYVPSVSTNPGDYYKNIDSSKTGDALRKDICALISKGHKNSTYDNLRNVFKTADADPNKSGNIKWFYTGTSVSFNGNFASASGGTNREHVWPKAGGDAFPEESGPGSDAHHLRPTEATLNSSRNNHSFDEVPQTAANIVSEAGKTNYANPCYLANGLFYPGKGYRGQTARILMYVQTRWGSEYDLKFVDRAGSVKTIGKISTLMKWHLEEPVCEDEVRRNEAIYKIQGNRNPFIDHPEYAEKIYCNDGESYNQALKNVVEQYSQNKDKLKSISLSKTSLNLGVGQSETLTVTSEPSSISNSVTWSSSDSSIAKVENGKVTALKNGEVTITATSTVDTSIKATCKVIVKAVDSISISGNATKSNYEEGDLFNPNGLKVTLKYYDNTTTTVNNDDCEWLDGATRSTTLSIGTTSVICRYAGKETTYSPINVTEKTNKTWKVVSDISTLQEGTQFVIGIKDKGAVSGNYNASKGYFETSTATFLADNINELPNDAYIFTLGKSGSYWTIKGLDNKLLGSDTSKDKKLIWDSNTNWTITIKNNQATIKNSVSGFYIAYNSSSPRFKTYDTNFSGGLIPEIYTYC